jgi:hypothetical protein
VISKEPPQGFGEEGSTQTSETVVASEMFRFVHDRVPPSRGIVDVGVCWVVAVAVTAGVAVVVAAEADLRRGDKDFASFSSLADLVLAFGCLNLVARVDFDVAVVVVDLIDMGSDTLTASVEGCRVDRLIVPIQANAASERLADSGLSVNPSIGSSVSGH